MKKEYTPEWAKRLEDWGRGMEAKYGKSEGNNFHKHQSGHNQWQQHRQNPVGDIFGQLIGYLIITYVPTYFTGFFLMGWSAVYTVTVFSIIIHVAVDLLLIVLTAKPFYYSGQVVANIASLVSMIVTVTIFPFNFPGTVGSIVQFALWIAIVILSIVTFFDFLRIFSPDWKMESR